MGNAKPKSVSVARRLFLRNPGSIQCRDTPDGPKTYWSGGQIAKVSEPLVEVVAWMQNSGCLPFGLTWIAHDCDEQVWYVSRVDDDPREVPID